MTTIYVVVSEWKDYAIAAVEVIKETSKQCQIDSKSIKEIHGRTYYLPQRLDKESRKYEIFPTLREAQAWCIEQMRKALAGLEKDADRMRGSIAGLEATMTQPDALAAHWPTLPELDGIDRFEQYPISGKD